MSLVNLLPPELRRKEAPKITLPEIPVKKTLLFLGVGILALQLLLSVVAVFYSTRYKIVKYETTSLSSRMGAVRQAKSQTSALAKKMQDIRTLTEKKFYWSRVLNDLSITTSRGIWLTSLSVEDLVVPKVKAKNSPDKNDKSKKEKKSVMAKEDGKAAEAKKAAVKKPEKEKASPEKSSTTAVEAYRVLKLEGSCVGSSGQETALIGKYLKSLRDDTYFKELFGDDIDLSGMNQRKMDEADVFNFVINCRFKRGKL